MPNAPFLAPERDVDFKDGRLKGGGTTFYSLPGVDFSTASTTQALNANRDFYGPFKVLTPTIADQLAFEVTLLQAGNARMGIYTADVDFQPVGAPLADSGDISTGTTGVKTYTPGTPVFLPRGRYVTAFTNNSGGPTCRAYRGKPVGVATAMGATALITDISVARTYAAFPTPGTAWDTTTQIGPANTGFYYFVLLRVSAP